MNPTAYDDTAALRAAVSSRLKERAMTPKRLRETREALRWSMSDLASAIGYSKANIQQMEMGRVSIPPALARWLERAVRWHEMNPPPTRSQMIRTVEMCGQERARTIT